MYLCPSMTVFFSPLSRPVSHVFFNDTATTEIYTLSLHDALPISAAAWPPMARAYWAGTRSASSTRRSEEHTSELQSQSNLVCRLLLEQKDNNEEQLKTVAASPERVQLAVGLAAA